MRDGGSRTNMLESLEHVFKECVGHAWLGVDTSLHAGHDREEVVNRSFRVSSRAVVVAKMPSFVAVFGVRGESKSFGVSDGVSDDGGGGGGGGGGAGAGGGGVAGAGNENLLGVSIHRTIEVTADVANASEQARALALVRVRFKLLDEVYFEHRHLAGDDKSAQDVTRMHRGKRASCIVRVMRWHT